MLILLRINISRLPIVSSLDSSGVGHSFGEDLAMLLPDSLHIFGEVAIRRFLRRGKSF